MAAVAVIIALFLKEIPLRSGKNMEIKEENIKSKVTTSKK